MWSTFIQKYGPVYRVLINLQFTIYPVAHPIDFSTMLLLLELFSCMDRI